MAQSIGELLREWRTRRRISQLDLALEAGISARHVSLVETGKSKPSRAMVLRLAEQLQVPLRYRNQLLLAAGFAPTYNERPLSQPEMSSAREALERVLAAQEPYPALVLDRRWNILMSNKAADPFFEGVDPVLLEPPVNMMRLGLHPKGLAPRILNLEEVRAALIARIARQVQITGDRFFEELLSEVLSYGKNNGESPHTDNEAYSRKLSQEITMPIRLLHKGVELSLFATITTFGTPQDITLDELVIESYFPADAPTAALF